MIFRKALIRLTVTYTLVQLLLFGAFALGVYWFVRGTFDFDAAQQLGDGSVNAAEQGFSTLRMSLIVGYAILVVLLPLSSFLMARAALAPIRRSYELQQRFVDGASHEFRTPLSVIQGELELSLTQARTPAQYRTAITRALEATEALVLLTNDLLLLTRESPAELQGTFGPVGLNELVVRAVDAHPADRARIRFAETEPVDVLGSRELLARSVANVVDNAVKFTSAPGTIEIAVTSSGKTASVVVRDEGIGMTQAELGRAFDRFWRSQDARATPGFGLGLPLVEQICQAHHGKVTIVSTPGSGTTAILTFPVFKPDIGSTRTGPIVIGRKDHHSNG